MHIALFKLPALTVHVTAFCVYSFYRIKVILTINNDYFLTQHSHNWLTFVNEMECVFFQVSLNIFKKIF